MKDGNKHLQEKVAYLKNLFNKLIKFIKNMMFGKDKQREDYWRVSKDMVNTEYLLLILSNQLKMIIFGIKESYKSRDKK